MDNEHMCPTLKVLVDGVSWQHASKYPLIWAICINMHSRVQPFSLYLRDVRLLRDLGEMIETT